MKVNQVCVSSVAKFVLHSHEPWFVWIEKANMYLCTQAVSIPITPDKHTGLHLAIAIAPLFIMLTTHFGYARTYLLGESIAV